MPADYTALSAAIAAAVSQVAATKTTEAGAKALIENFSASVTKAVTDALTADNAADQGSIDAAVQAINDTTAQYLASSNDLGAAVVAGTPASGPSTP